MRVKTPVLIRMARFYRVLLHFSRFTGFYWVVISVSLTITIYCVIVIFTKSFFESLFVIRLLYDKDCFIPFLFSSFL